MRRRWPLWATLFLPDPWEARAPDYTITKADVDKFLSETSRSVIDGRLLIATTDRVGANAKRVMADQPKPVVLYLRTQLDNAAVIYPEDPSGLIVTVDPEKLCEVQ